MARREDEAYVLRTRPLGEADVLVTLLTAEEGKMAAVARSAKKSRRRFGAALEPLTRVRAQWREREGRNLAQLDSCEIVRSYVQAQRDPARFYLFSYIAEVADVFAREKEPDPRFFRLLGAVLDAAAEGLPARAARRYYDLWTLRLQGLLPELAACAGCGAEPGDPAGGGALVDLAEGRLLCARCGRGAGGERVRLSPAAFVAARMAMRRPPAGASALDRPGLEGLDLLVRRAMLRFTERPLRTLPFLAEAGL